MNSALLSSDKMDWCTPQEFFDTLNTRFNFTLDAAATKHNSKCVEWFDSTCDTFRQSWRVDVGAVWLNPPYGRELPKWIDKAIEEAKNGTTVVMLVPARPDTKWFARAWEATRFNGEVLFVRGRLRFEGASSAAPFPSVVLVFRTQNAVTQLRRVGFLTTKGDRIDLQNCS